MSGHRLASDLKLLLFDIDGTLLLSGGAGLRALNQAFTDLFAIENAFEGIPVAGRTDPLLLRDATARAGSCWTAANARRSTTDTAICWSWRSDNQDHAKV